MLKTDKKCSGTGGFQYDLMMTFLIVAYFLGHPEDCTDDRYALDGNSWKKISV